MAERGWRRILSFDPVQLDSSCRLPVQWDSNAQSYPSRIYILVKVGTICYLTDDATVTASPGCHALTGEMCVSDVQVSSSNQRDLADGRASNRNEVRARPTTWPDSRRDCLPGFDKLAPVRSLP